MRPADRRHEAAHARGDGCGGGPPIAGPLPQPSGTTAVSARVAHTKTASERRRPSAAATSATRPPSGPNAAAGRALGVPGRCREIRREREAGALRQAAGLVAGQVEAGERAAAASASGITAGGAAGVPLRLLAGRGTRLREPGLPAPVLAIAVELPRLAEGVRHGDGVRADRGAAQRGQVATMCGSRTPRSPARAAELRCRSSSARPRRRRAGHRRGGAGDARTRER